MCKHKLSIGVDLKKLVFVLVFLLTACVAEFGDDSKNYQSIMNAEYETTSKLFVFGYTLKVEEEPKIDGYALHEPPGISGPEILSKSQLPIGSKFRIYKVVKCSNCFPFSSYRHFLIKIEGSENLKDSYSFW